jgi:hypothetical protein
MKTTTTVLLASLLTLLVTLPGALAAPTTPQYIHQPDSTIVLPPGITSYRLADTTTTHPTVTVLSLPLPTPLSDGTDWSNSGGNAQRNGLSTTTGPTTADLLWSGGRSSLISWLPVTEGDRLFVVRQKGWPGSTNDSIIVAMNLVTGDELWTAAIPYHSGDWTTWVAGVKDGHVYGSRSGNGASVKDNLYALDAQTGTLLWTSTDLIDAGPYDGVVFASNGDPIVASFMDIWRFNADTGAVTWHANRLGSVSGSCGGALYQDAFYVADAAQGGHIIVKYDATTGERQYQSPVMPGFTVQNTPMVGPDGTIYLCRTQNNPAVDFFYAFTDTGTALEEKWHIPCAWTTFSEFTTGPDSVDLLVPGPRVAKVSSLDGTLIGQTEIVPADISPTPHFAVDNAGTTYVSNGGFDHGKLLVYTSSLVPVWNTTVHNINIGGPALGHNGVLLVCGVGTDIRAYHQPLPVFTVNITGGLFKVHGTVTNIGTVAIENLSWTISVHGGLLKRIDTTTTDVIAQLPNGQSAAIATNGILFGFGKLEVTATVGDESTTVKGFLLGPFISIQ